MKTLTYFVGTVTLSAGLSIASGCATLQGGKSAQDLAANGPTIVDVKTSPDTFELNSQMQPNGQAQVLADVKDFQARITQVRLRFLHVPLELEMSPLQGTTWQATLTAAQLRQLAVNGQTMRYEANVIATDDQGQIATSQKPVQIAVKALEANKRTT